MHKVAWILVLAGSLNWLLVGLANFNLVMTLFGAWPWLERLIYILVGVAGASMLGLGKCCMKGGMCMCHDGDCTHCGMPEKKMSMPKMEEKKPMGGM